MDDAVEHFMAFTGTTADIARRYLGLTENNTEQAVQLFFDSPELASGIDEAAQPPAPTIPAAQEHNANTSQRASKNLIEIDSDDDENMDIDDNAEDEEGAASRAAAVVRAVDYEDDEAVARRLQEELYAGADGSSGYDADGVRAPIGRTTETLVGGPGGDWSPDDMHAAVLQQMRARNRPCMYFKIIDYID